MGSRASINISAGSYIKLEVCAEITTKYYYGGVKIKCKNLLKWMQRTGYTAYRVARAMRIHPRQLERKLRKEKPFTQRQIRELTYLMGAWEMFFVIYFPTSRERRRVFRETFGYELNEVAHEKRHQRIIWAKKTGGGRVKN